jgi:single-strand selective monofunctional uracil DNA glycosylase
MDPPHITDRLIADLAPLTFAPPVTHVYNPLVYARAAHLRYLETCATESADTILVGMNPGPWGMVQTGVPFGEVNFVRDWMGISAAVGKPEREHAKRIVVGFSCRRSEVSGRRLWGWAKDSFGAAQQFFSRFFVVNYCPLAFFEESGRNRTPDKLPAEERSRLFAACDKALQRYVAHFEPQFVIGIGAFATARAEAALSDTGVTIGRIAHPSPANPAANRGWAALIEGQLEEIGVCFK